MALGQLPREELVGVHQQTREEGLRERGGTLWEGLGREKGQSA